MIASHRQGAGLAVLLLDREIRDECPGKLADDLEQAIARACSTLEARVIYKDRTFENWLIADVEALKNQPGRFNMTAALERRVAPDRADKCDGLSLIKLAVKGGHYEKVRDSEAICRKMDVLRTAKNSRSFRHFLHLLGVSPYAAQCVLP